MSDRNQGQIFRKITIDMPRGHGKEGAVKKIGPNRESLLSPLLILFHIHQEEDFV
jgi:hypothetical protein